MKGGFCGDFWTGGVVDDKRGTSRREGDEASLVSKGRLGEPSGKGGDAGVFNGKVADPTWRECRAASGAQDLSDRFCGRESP